MLTVPGTIKQLYNRFVLAKNSHSTCGGKKVKPRCNAVLYILSQVLHPPVESLCFKIRVIGSHKSLMNNQLCQKDVHFTTGLRAALPGNKAEMESHRKKTLWTNPTHPSPPHYTTEARRESDSSYVHV